MVKPRSRELLRSLGSGVLFSSLFGALFGISIALPAGQGVDVGLFRGVLTGLMAGTTVGGLEILVDRGTLMWRIRRLPTVAIVLLRLTMYTICLVACIMIGRAVTWFVFGIDGNFIAFDIDFWSAASAVSALAILLMVAYKAMPLIGLSTLTRIVLGLYMKPRKEERAILFMDLIGSTTLTERIGNAGFMRFLNDSIFAMTHAIFRNNGSIYRYVGDEIIISWPAADASRALKCAFDIEKALKQRRAHFKRRYDTFPRFRYGLHLGEVMMGELGDLRVEIAMIGDAINTTKRIEDACRQFDFNIMASSFFVGRAQLPPHIRAVPVDAISLRGKSDPLRLYGLVHSEHRLVSNPGQLPPDDIRLDRPSYHAKFEDEP